MTQRASRAGTRRRGEEMGGEERRGEERGGGGIDERQVVEAPREEGKN